MSNAARPGAPNAAAALGWRRDASPAECKRTSETRHDVPEEPTPVPGSLSTASAGDELDVAVADRVVRPGAEQREQIGDDGCFVLRIALRPRARLHLDEIALARRVQQPIEVHVELDAAVDEQPPAPVLLHDVLGGRAEVLAVEPGRVRGEREIPRAE